MSDPLRTLIFGTVSVPVDDNSRARKRILKARAIDFQLRWFYFVLNP
jgi:hypothetical protein